MHIYIYIHVEYLIARTNYYTIVKFSYHQHIYNIQYTSYVQHTSFTYYLRTYYTQFHLKFADIREFSRVIYDFMKKKSRYFLLKCSHAILYVEVIPLL